MRKIGEEIVRMPSSEIIEAAHKETEKVRKHIEAYESLENKHNNYWGAPTACMQAIAEYGAENIFLVSESYRSHAYDDYASFRYWNQKTGEYFDDGWTTAGACPAYDSHKCMTISEAFKVGLLDENKYIGVLVGIQRKAIENFRLLNLYTDDWLRYKLKVEVYKGRKWKGVGYVIRKREASYGYRSTTYLSILDPETKIIHEIDANNAQVYQLDKIIEDYKRWALGHVEEISDDCELVPLINGVAIKDINKKTGFKEFLGLLAEDTVIDLEGAVDPVQDAIDKRKAEFKEKKMAELVKWVKENTDKKGDEIQELAERIWNKKYA